MRFAQTVCSYCIVIDLLESITDLNDALADAADALNSKDNAFTLAKIQQCAQEMSPLETIHGHFVACMTQLPIDQQAAITSTW